MTSSTDELSKKLLEVDELVKNKNYQEAVKALRTLIGEYPDSALIHSRLGNLLLYSQSQSQALQHIQKAIEIEPDNLQYRDLLANYYIRHKDEKSVIDTYENALEHNKDNPKILLKLATLYKEYRNYERSYQILTSLLESEPDNMEYLAHYTGLLGLIGKGGELIDQYNLLLQDTDGKIPGIVFQQWFTLMMKADRNNEAQQTLQKHYDAGEKGAIFLRTYIKCLMENMRYQEAYSIAERAHDLYPNDTMITNNLTTICYSLGMVDLGEKYNEMTLKLDPFFATAAATYSFHGKAEYGNKYFNAVALASSRITKMDKRERTAMHFALGKIFDDVGDLPTAFEHYRLGCELRIEDETMETYYLSVLFKDMKKFFDQSFIEAHRGLGNPSKKPMFIVGMPRSGTTLMEQVLSAIDGVVGVGELRYLQLALHNFKMGDRIFASAPSGHFSKHENATLNDRALYYLRQIESLSPVGAKRIINKLPGNFAWIGLILLLFPNAYILHSRRHPVEVCLSAYRILFAEGQIWSYDLKEMGRFYRVYWEIMKFWKEILPEGSILDVYYENMVDNLEDESKRIAKFIEMPWSEKCLEFHKSDKVVKTASITQVRKPIYKTSTNRWRRYEPYLKPLLDEIGDLIEAYEIELAEDRKKRNL